MTKIGYERSTVAYLIVATVLFSGALWVLWSVAWGPLISIWQTCQTRALLPSCVQAFATIGLLLATSVLGWQTSRLAKQAKTQADIRQREMRLKEPNFIFHDPLVEVDKFIEYGDHQLLKQVVFEIDLRNTGEMDGVIVRAGITTKNLDGSQWGPHHLQGPDTSHTFLPDGDPDFYENVHEASFPHQEPATVELTYRHILCDKVGDLSLVFLTKAGQIERWTFMIMPTEDGDDWNLIPIPTPVGRDRSIPDRLKDWYHRLTRSPEPDTSA